MPEAAPSASAPVQTVAAPDNPAKKPFLLMDVPEVSSVAKDRGTLAWDMAQKLPHSFRPDPDADYNYLRLVHDAARAGNEKAMVKLGEYARRRCADVEEYYWLTMARLHGAKGLEPMLDYCRNQWKLNGFNPEYGTCALPSVEALREFMPEELLWPVEKNAAAWKYREGGGFDRMTQEHHAFVKAYGRADSIDEYARRSEAADALGHQTLWEVWNMARNTATGILFWYNNTPVPQIGSHAWDYGLEQGAAFFAQKRALEPLHAQYDYRTRRVVLTSDLLDEKRLTVRAEVWNLDSKKIWEKSVAATLPGETALELFEIPEAKGVEFVRLYVEEGDRTVGSQLSWRSTDAYGGRDSVTGPCASGFEAMSDLPKTALKVGCADQDGVKRIRVANAGDKLAFMVRIKFLTKDGKRVTGTFFDDNYFTLFPGEAKTVTVEGVPADAVMDVSAWNAGTVR